jgi:hypothetical protein
LRKSRMYFTGYWRWEMKSSTSALDVKCILLIMGVDCSSLAAFLSCTSPLRPSRSGPSWW